MDWCRLARLGYDPPLIPPRGEVNAADAFDIGNFDDDETKGIKLNEGDLAHYENFTTIVSSRWQQEVRKNVKGGVKTFEGVGHDLERCKYRTRSRRQSLDQTPVESIRARIWQGRHHLGPLSKTRRPLSIAMAGKLHRRSFFRDSSLFFKRKHLFLFPNRLELGIDGDLHVWPLEELIAISDHTHRGNRTIQLRYILC